ncbi:hypothetical protein ACS0TY_033583 [Phlomoides rotata]
MRDHKGSKKEIKAKANKITGALIGFDNFPTTLCCSLIECNINVTYIFFVIICINFVEKG